MAEVLHLFQSLEKGESVREFEAVQAVENKGFRDCVHGRSGSSRQVLLMDIETLEEFGIPPGRAKENITTRGIDLSELFQGQRIRVGESILEVTKPCTPCHQMDEIRAGLQEALRGRRGILCRVVRSGGIRRGTAIEVFEQREPLKAQEHVQAG